MTNEKALEALDKVEHHGNGIDEGAGYGGGYDFEGAADFLNELAETIRKALEQNNPATSSVANSSDTNASPSLRAEPCDDTERGIDKPQSVDVETIQLIAKRLNNMEHYIDPPRLAKQRGVLDDSAFHIGNCIKDIRACLDHLHAQGYLQSGWRDIELADRADGPYVVGLFDKKGRLCWCCKAEWDGDYQRWRGGDFNELLVEPSHFQQIPKPPTQEE